MELFTAKQTLAIAFAFLLVVGYFTTAAENNRLVEENRQLMHDNGTYLTIVNELMDGVLDDASCSAALVEAKILHADQLRLRKGGKPRVR